MTINTFKDIKEHKLINSIKMELNQEVMNDFITNRGENNSLHDWLKEKYASKIASDKENIYTIILTGNITIESNNEENKLDLRNCDFSGIINGNENEHWIKFSNCLLDGAKIRNTDVTIEFGHNCEAKIQSPVLVEGSEKISYQINNVEFYLQRSHTNAELKKSLDTEEREKAANKACGTKIEEVQQEPNKNDKKKTFFGKFKGLIPFFGKENIKPEKKLLDQVEKNITVYDCPAKRRAAIQEQDELRCNVPGFNSNPLYNPNEKEKNYFYLTINQNELDEFLKQNDEKNLNEYIVNNRLRENEMGAKEIKMEIYKHLDKKKDGSDEICTYEDDLSNNNTADRAPIFRLLYKLMSSKEGELSLSEWRELAFMLSNIYDASREDFKSKEDREMACQKMMFNLMQFSKERDHKNLPEIAISCNNLELKGNINGKIFNDIVFPGANISANFEDCEMTNISFAGTTFNNSSFKKVKLENCNFNYCEADKINFKSCNINDLSMRYGIAKDIKFEECEIKGIKLKNGINNEIAFNGGKVSEMETYGNAITDQLTIMDAKIERWNAESDAFNKLLIEGSRLEKCALKRITTLETEVTKSFLEQVAIIGQEANKIKFDDVEFKECFAKNMTIADSCKIIGGKIADTIFSNMNINDFNIQDTTGELKMYNAHVEKFNATLPEMEKIDLSGSQFDEAVIKAKICKNLDLGKARIKELIIKELEKDALINASAATIRNHTWNDKEDKGYRIKMDGTYFSAKSEKDIEGLIFVNADGKEISHKELMKQMQALKGFVDNDYLIVQNLNQAMALMVQFEKDHKIINKLHGLAEKAFGFDIFSFVGGIARFSIFLPIMISMMTLWPLLGLEFIGVSIGFIVGMIIKELDLSKVLLPKNLALENNNNENNDKKNNNGELNTKINDKISGIARLINIPKQTIKTGLIIAAAGLPLLSFGAVMLFGASIPLFAVMLGVGITAGSTIPYLINRLFKNYIEECEKYNEYKEEKERCELKITERINGEEAEVLRNIFGVEYNSTMSIEGAQRVVDLKNKMEENLKDAKFSRKETLEGMQNILHLTGDIIREVIQGEMKENKPTINDDLAI